MIICRKVKLSNLHTHKTWDMSVCITILRFPGTYSFFSWIRIRIKISVAEPPLFWAAPGSGSATLIKMIRIRIQEKRIKVAVSRDF